jgi:hypothetical protein
MKESMDIFVRAHTELVKARERQHRPNPKPNLPDAKKESVPKWPRCALVIDCETTTDERQALTFGCYRFCRADASSIYTAIEEGFFYSDDLPTIDKDGIRNLRQYVGVHSAETPQRYSSELRLLPRSEFIERVFWRAITTADALVVGFNLPFDLSRIAIECSTARRRNEGWSLILFQDTDPETGQLRENPCRPRIIVRPKDSKAAFIRFAGVSIRSKKTKRRLIPYRPGRFVDLRTLGWALRNRSYSLQSACEDFEVPGKLDHEPTGRVTLEEIEYCRQDVRGSVGLMNAMRAEFDKHPIDLHPDRAFSPASIAKAYLKQMGVIPPPQKFVLPPWVQGAAMQAYYGGRAECRIRHTAVPVVHTDFLSEYPTVNTLMGLSRLLTARSLRIEDATDEVRTLLTNLTPNAVFEQAFWKDLLFFALVRPAGDILPVRTNYNGETSNIGVNPLTSDEPIWYAGPDLVSAAMQNPSGKPPEIIRAFRVVAEGQQIGLKPVALGGAIEIDPRTDDFFKMVIEARQRLKSDHRLSEPVRKALRYFLKILANAGSYGLFVEVNPERVGSGMRESVRVFSGEAAFPTTTPVVEKPGAWYCPLFAALITAAGRLLLSLLERSIADAGGTYLLCDTDSMAIVASETGGLVPSAGGPEHLPEQCDGIKALSWPEVDAIVSQFEKLNPYDQNIVQGSILKIEDVNFGPEKARRQLYGYAIAAKRYALFTRTPNGIQVEKASAHGLGFLYPPKCGFDAQADAPVWVIEAWDWILREAFGIPQDEPSWFSLPAMMRFTITTPEVLKVLLARQRGLPYRDRAKPFNFVLSPMIDPLGGYPIGADRDRFTLIAPYTSDPSRWYQLAWVNVHDGKQYHLARPGKRLPYEAESQRCADVVGRYRWHPEAKSLAPDGSHCISHTSGLLRRTPVVAALPFRYIGKETNRRWEQGEDISMLLSNVLEYSSNETAQLVIDPTLQRDARRMSIRALAKAANVSDKTVKAARSGQRLRRSTIRKLDLALKVGGADPHRKKERLVRKNRKKTG